MIPPGSRRTDERDQHLWGRSDSAALGGLLAMAGWTLLCLLLSCCGDSPGTTLAERVYDATTDAWMARGDLPEIRDSGDYCGHLDRFEILTPATPDEYRKWCPERSWACLEWELLPGRVRSLYYPVAVLSPALKPERHAAGAIHELLHALVHCSSSPPRYDYGHRDPRIWEGTVAAPRPDSVETMAERALYGD